MIDNDIKVTIISYADRRYFVMRYTDPVTGKRIARSTGTSKRREAERKAAKWEAELREGRYQTPTRTSWEEFRERYENEKVPSLADNTAAAITAAFNHLERVIGPEKLAALTTATISRFQAVLRGEGMRDTTIAVHLRHLRASLRWAVSMGMLRTMPEFHMPKRIKGRTLMRGRPLTDGEFKEMLAQIPDVRPKDPEAWSYFLNGLWLSGLRLEESLVLTWDEDSPFSVDLSGRRPRLRIFAEAEKGHEDRLLPMTPDFATFLLKTPKRKRTGLVFRLFGLLTGEQMTSARVGRVVSELGRRAEIVVNKSEGRHATAHDLRRSFGTRWASKVMPATLQLLMRHKSIETTTKYYVDQDADAVADALWAEYERSDEGSSRRRTNRKR